MPLPRCHRRRRRSHRRRRAAAAHIARPPPHVGWVAVPPVPAVPRPAVLVVGHVPPTPQWGLVAPDGRVVVVAIVHAATAVAGVKERNSTYR